MLKRTLRSRSCMLWNWARICKRLRSSEIDSKKSIPPAFVAWLAGTSNGVVVPARQAGNRFLGSLKGLQIRALVSDFQFTESVCSQMEEDFNGSIFSGTGMLSWCDFLAGCIGGCAGVMVGHPLDTLKVSVLPIPHWHGPCRRVVT
jgi:hypothetical protein